MDDIDRSIIAALEEDGRVPFTQLGRDLGISESAVRQRVVKLQENGQVRIVALCNPLSLGHQPVRLLVKVHDLSPRVVAKSLCAVRAINHVALTAGGHDIYVEATCRDQAQLLEILDHVRMMTGVADVRTLLLLELTKDYSWTGLVNAVGRNLTPEA
ncbi:Lrp/AsnC family transcriptional regulator [Allobranchiibius huperziae]|uniref:Lrp/AsnC family transcriptional regulator for asnA, asnC and gidA n=1 Tax=Allobranchiibius huperziae TaxID=1874116 RepID=A0A853DG87_9MICO|nr:Lrp/AsnC family transcriptional regulator [Allobranchiibius huperziae]NYJ76556.1 Lrp/AsnC family transcriptional regulator for asnA, asnC and gidA [Allobranchiibius huperziae]